MDRIGAPSALGPWEYSRSLFCLGLLEVYARTHDERLLRFARGWVDSHLDRETGLPDHPTDALNFVLPANLLLALSDFTHEQRYRNTAYAIAEQMKDYPTTEDGAVIHDTTPERRGQLWLDGAYMALPLLARAGQPERAVTQLLLYEKHLKDPLGPLYFHVYDASGSASWRVPGTQHSCCKWARAQGWFLMAIVDVLDSVPQNVAGRRELLNILRRDAKELVKMQDPSTGLWFQIIDEPGTPGNFVESSSSAMLAYALARASEKGYISARYRRNAHRALHGVDRLVRVHPDDTVSLTRICIGTNVGDRDYYLTRPVVEDDMHGIGAFLVMEEELKYHHALSWMLPPSTGSFR